MGILIGCDICGKMTEIDNANQLFVIARGNEILFEGYVCDDCIRKISEYINQLIKSYEEELKKPVEFGSEEPKNEEQKV